jgi:hypothetical protein
MYDCVSNLNWDARQEHPHEHLVETGLHFCSESALGTPEIQAIEASVRPPLELMQC